MRDRNENIHLFILEEERRRNRALVLKEKILREKFLNGESQEPTEQPVRSQQDSSPIPDKLCEKEAKLLDCENRSVRDKQESDFGAVERVAILKHEMRSLKTGIFGFDWEGRNLKIGLGASATVVACSLVSISALLRLDAVVHQDLYSYGLQFSLEWATPYWFAIRIALAALCLVIFTAVLSQVYALRFRSESRRANGHWETYALADGSTIRVKTVVKGAKRLQKYDHDGKPIYSVETDNVVELVKR